MPSEDVLKLARRALEWCANPEDPFNPDLVEPLARAVVELSEDKDRLDWLEAQGQVIVVRGKTFRATLDAARKEQGE